MPDSELNSFDFIATHCGFGIFNRIRESKRMIVLREPIERVRSHYYYLKNLDAHVSHASQHAKSMSLTEFVLNPNAAVSVGVENSQVYHLIEDKNAYSRIKYKNLSNREKVELALEHLSTYDFVGFTDDLNEIVNRIVSHYGWHSCQIPHLAKSILSDCLPESQAAIKAISSKVELDLLLFKEAQSLYRC